MLLKDLKMKQVKDRLPKAFKKKWIAALRSGDYKQGMGTLYDFTDDRYCCLGVAGIVGGLKQKEISKADILNGVELGFDPVKRGVPEVICGRNNNPIVSKLIDMNDAQLGFDFNGIANWIEENL